MQELQPLAQVVVASRRPQEIKKKKTTMNEQEEGNLFLQQHDDGSNKKSSETKSKANANRRTHNDTNNDEVDFSRCDFKTRMKLLQNKLHPNHSSGIEDAGGGSICSSRNENDSCSQASCCSTDGEEESSISMSSSSSASSSCSPPPTPPPRHSSLLERSTGNRINQAQADQQRQPEASRSAAVNMQVPRMHIQLDNSFQRHSPPISDNGYPTTTMQLDTHAIQRQQQPALSHATPLPLPLPATATATVAVAVAESDHRIGQPTGQTNNNGGNGQPQMQKAHHANQLPPSITIRQNVVGNNLQLQPAHPLIQMTSISQNQPHLQQTTTTTTASNKFVAGRQQNLSSSSSSSSSTCGSVNYLPRPNAEPPISRTCYNSHETFLMNGPKVCQPPTNPTGRQQQPLRVLAPFSSMVDLHRLPIQQQQPSSQQQQSRLSDDRATFDNLLHSSQPITKAVRNMVSKQQQQQQTVSYVINTPSSRHPIRGCPLPPIPPNKPPNLMQLTSISPHLTNVQYQKQQQQEDSPPPQLPSKKQTFAPQAQARSIRRNNNHQLGSHPSVSMSSISSQASIATTSSSSASAVQQQQLNSARNVSSPPFHQLNIANDSSIIVRPVGCQQQQISSAATQQQLLANTKNTPVSPLPSPSRQQQQQSPTSPTEVASKLNETTSTRQKQHIKDSTAASRRERHQECLAGGFGDQEDLEDALLTSTTSADCCECQCGSSAATKVPAVETIVNEQGDHCVLVGGFSVASACQLVELNGDLFALDEECGSMLSRHPDAETCCQVQQQQQPKPIVEMRGWPMSEFEDDEDDFVLLNTDTLKNLDHDDHDDTEQVSSWWPIVGLHENPMNWLPPSPAPQSNALESFVAAGAGESSGEMGVGLLEVGVIENCEGESGENLLERSRLLSLQASQLKNRAAIRMISSDSVQLLVSAVEQSAAAVGSKDQCEERKLNNSCLQEEEEDNNDCWPKQVKLEGANSGGGTLVIVAPELAKRPASRSGSGQPGDLLASKTTPSAGCAKRREEGEGETKERHDSNCNSNPDKSSDEFSKQQQQVRQRRHVEQLMRLRQLANIGNSKSNSSSAGARRPREELPTLEQLQRQIQLACELAGDSKRPALATKSDDHRHQHQHQHQRDSNWPAEPTTTTIQQRPLQNNSQQQQDHCGNEASEQLTAKQPVQQPQVKLPATMAASTATAEAKVRAAGAALFMDLDKSKSGLFISEMEEQQQKQMAHESSWPILVEQKSNHLQAKEDNSATIQGSDTTTTTSRQSECGHLLTTADRVQQPSWPLEKQSVVGPNNIQDELSIMTSSSSINSPLIENGNPRLADRRLADCCSSSSSGQSTPSAIGADSTLAESDMIPKLIERLDRKLIVMKEEQLTLMREIELNESTGQRLFESMRRRLNDNELDKITLHANEIEKVTKLILSLELRLKRVEVELKERSKKKKKKQQQQRLQDSPAPSSCNSSIDEHQVTNNNNNSSQQNCSSSLVAGDELSQAQAAILVNKQQLPLTSNKTNKQTLNNPPVRGVSDPTSTIGLPKRNHQHHASLQSSDLEQQPKSASRASNRVINDPVNQAQVGQIGIGSRTNNNSNSSRINDNQHQYSLNSSVESSLNQTSGCTSRVGSPRVDANHHHHPVGPQIVGHDDNDAVESESKSAKSSSDSIFNSADSAIGSTITGHGGSISNIEDSHPAHSHHHQAESPGATGGSRSRLACSTTSVASSHDDSISTSTSILNSPFGLKQQRPHHEQLSLVSPQHTVAAATILSPTGSCDQQQQQQQQQQSSILDREAIIQMVLSDVDILMAKRTKLVSQLEEAHQLEECIVGRNNVIVQRILRKYFDENSPDGLIAEFRRFTKLKSLLLKDSHDISDRIDNAELQLNELKQTNHCSGSISSA